MIRECAITCYLFLFRVCFSIAKLFPQKEKALFIPYFGYNALHTIEALESLTSTPVVIINTKHCRVSFTDSPQRTIIDLRSFHLVRWFQMVYHLATSDKVIVDNYLGFLAATPFKKGTTCVQLWHAAGAVKKFGLEDLSNQTRSPRAIKRFQLVYSRFDHVVVGSDKMEEIFCRSFGIGPEKILRTGIPRTDFFFDAEKTDAIKTKLLHEYPLLQGKKVLLYAPTFRDGDKAMNDLPFSLSSLYEAFSGEYVLVIKTHPLVKNTIESTYADFVLDLSHYENTNHLLLLTDVLISDYSSVPFEFAFLKRPMIFYVHDLEDYTRERGVWEEFSHFAPGPIVKTTEELVTTLQLQQFDEAKIQAFHETWNRYSTGESSRNLIRFLYPNE